MRKEINKEEGNQMKKILIATRNKDKFRIVKKLLSTNNFKNFDFYSLDDIKEEILDKKEIGDIENRSLQKAKNAYDVLKESFDYIVGVDDGIKIKGNVIENVKKYIKLIIEDDFLEEKEIVQIVRAYTFINKEGIFKSIVTEIPFEYIKLQTKINISENSYPLSYVLSPIGTLKTVVELSEEESNLYYLKYSQKEFDKVENFFL